MAYPNETPTGGQSEYGATVPPVSVPGQAGAAGWTVSSVDPRATDTDQTKEVASHTMDRAKDVAATAQDEAKAVADTAKDAGGHVAQTAQQEAAEVVEEAKVQGRRLLDESMYELRTQASTGQHLVAELARSLSGELRAMSQADQDGMLAGYVDKAQRFSDDAAAWLESRQPDEVLESVRRYAARNPWQFLAISAGVGFVGARIYRGLQGAKADEASRGRPAAGYRPGAAVPGSYPTPHLGGQYPPTPSGAVPRRESQVASGTFVEPESQYEDLTVEGGDPWREGLR